jgi:hypothetical protein
VPVSNDVHYGMTDNMVLFYLDYHTRDHFDVIERTLEVSPEVAEMVFRRVRDHGAVPKAMCADSISVILRDVPGFESIRTTWFPINLGKQFGQIPGVRERYLTEADVPNTHGVVLVDRQGNRVN